MYVGRSDHTVCRMVGYASWDAGGKESTGWRVGLAGSGSWEGDFEGGQLRDMDRFAASSAILANSLLPVYVLYR
jgi:hypothetical protein